MQCNNCDCNTIWYNDYNCNTMQHDVYDCDWQAQNLIGIVDWLGDIC